MAEKMTYVLAPGYVTSKTDGDRHYITAEMLQQLYNVDLDQCVKEPRDKQDWLPPENAIYLRPRYDGNYSLPI